MLWLNYFVTAGILYRDEKSSFNQPVYYRISFLIIYFTNWLIDYLQNVGSYIVTGYTNTWHQIWIFLFKRSTDFFFLSFSAHKHANEPIPININAILYWPFFIWVPQHLDWYNMYDVPIPERDTLLIYLHCIGRNTLC